MNLCYLDCETTGLDPAINAIVQVAGIVEIHGNVCEEFNIKMRPESWHKVEQKALDINGITHAQLASFGSQEEGRNLLKELLKPYGKLTLCGYNVGFDKGFVQAWLGQSFRFFFEYKPVDVYSLAYLFAETFGWPVANHKLATICQHLTIPIEAHDALSDIKATRVMFLHMQRMLKGDREVGTPVKNEVVL